MKINIINYFNQTDYTDVIKHVLTVGEKALQLEKKEINIILVDNLQIKELNRQYRNKDYATDVLTFPDGYYNNLGDVFISIEKCDEQAKDYGHSFERELGFLTIHGFLHTLGYDHIEKEDEEVMIPLQEKILHKAKLFR